MVNVVVAEEAPVLGVQFETGAVISTAPHKKPELAGVTELAEEVAKALLPLLQPVIVHLLSQYSAHSSRCQPHTRHIAIALPRLRGQFRGE